MVSRTDEQKIAEYDRITNLMRRSNKIQRDQFEARLKRIAAEGDD